MEEHAVHRNRFTSKHESIQSCLFVTEINKQTHFNGIDRHVVCGGCVIQPYLCIWLTAGCWDALEFYSFEKFIKRGLVELWHLGGCQKWLNMAGCRQTLTFFVSCFQSFFDWNLQDNINFMNTTSVSKKFAQITSRAVKKISTKHASHQSNFSHHHPTSLWSLKI